ncbi:28S ribosomal protein S23, mitochondrial [Chiloscyllium plagiosum]|uniref:28S ribosomal protein S23, mitochondrial n=1 Tax=Chiloscyllium plagiosum TaxID=36176 RepID=UPI001CB7E62D|nr:28S ribosomal protein S23, mitochondrial [Chiloscyllium plagiosum]
MAGSRLEKCGTIFTRVRDLLRAGVMKESEKPCWYDVCAAFPPKYEPVYAQPKERFGKVQDPVQEIFYQEDTIRAKFYEVYGNGPRPFDLTRSNFVSTCQRFVEKYQELEAQGEVDEEKLFEATSRALLMDGVVLRRRGRAGISGFASDDPQDSKTRNPVLDMKLQDLLKGMQEEQQEQTQEERQLQAQQETQSH